MFNLRFYILFCMLILFGASCSFKEERISGKQLMEQYMWQLSMPIPEFVSDKTTILGQSGFEEDVCVALNERAIWEPGDFGSDVYENIRHNTTIVIDGKIIRDLHYSSSLILLARYNEKGELIGTHSGETAICFNVNELIPGTHLALIETYSTSGIRYSYLWEFEVY